MSAIDDKYFALGGPGGFLGNPADAGAGSEEMDTADRRGRFRDFDGGFNLLEISDGSTRSAR